MRDPADPLSLPGPFSDAKLFYHLEDWLPNPEAANTTMYLARLADFQKFNATVAHVTAGGSEKTFGSSRARPVRFLLALRLAQTNTRYID
jgi:hypothetical protein